MLPVNLLYFIQKLLYVRGISKINFSSGHSVRSRVAGADHIPAPHAKCIDDLAAEKTGTASNKYSTLFRAGHCDVVCSWLGVWRV